RSAVSSPRACPLLSEKRLPRQVPNLLRSPPMRQESDRRQGTESAFSYTLHSLEDATRPQSWIDRTFILGWSIEGPGCMRTPKPTQDRFWERLETGDWRLETGDWRLETGDWRLETGDRRLETGDRRLETGDRRPETGDGRPETGDNSTATGHWRTETSHRRPDSGDTPREARSTP